MSFLSLDVLSLRRYSSISLVRCVRDLLEAKVILDGERAPGNATLHDIRLGSCGDDVSLLFVIAFS